MDQVSIKRARKMSGLTQEELSKKMGVSRRSISDWEHGKKKISKSHLIAFSVVTGIEQDKIFLP